MMSMRCLGGMQKGVAVATILLAGFAVVLRARGQEPSVSTVDLPGTVSETEIGASGKYLIMHFGDLRKLAVFDFSQRKVVKYISADDSDVKFAAGAEKLFVYLGGSGVISRYDLSGTATGREATAPISEKVAAMAMGYASDGPLWIVTSGGFPSHSGHVYDPKTLKSIPVRIQGGRNLPTTPKGLFECGSILRASADGRVLGSSDSSGSPRGVYLGIFNGSSVTCKYEHSSWGIIRPGPYGDTFFCSRGTMNTDLKQVDKTDQYVFLIHAIGGNYHLRLDQSGEKQRTPVLSIHCGSDDRPLASLPAKSLGLAEIESHPVGFANESYDKRVFLNVDEKLLVTVDSSGQKLVLTPIDVDRLLDESGIDYLYVTSRPPRVAEPGKEFRYRMSAKSQQGGVTFKLDSGPQGMRVDGNVLRWAVPRSAAGVETVLLTVSDASGREVFHKFPLQIGSGAASPSAGGLPAMGAAPQKFVQKSTSLVEMPGGKISVFRGSSPGEVLVLKGRQLAFLEPDGITISRQSNLGRDYHHVAARKDYLLAVPDGEKELHLIDRRTLKVRRKVLLPSSKVTGVAIHPSRPLSYVALWVSLTELPGTRVVLVDETSGKAKQVDDWIGSRVAVDPTGRYLVTGYSDYYRAGSRLLMNPGRLHVLPSYQSIDWLVRYRLDRTGRPDLEELQDKSSSVSRGVRISADGEHVATVCQIRLIKIWNLRDFEEVPVSVRTDVPKECNDLSFHPELKVAAVLSGAAPEPILIDYVTGQTIGEVKPAQARIGGASYKGLFFSPNGDHLILRAEAGGVDFLVKTEFVLPDADRRRLHLKSIPRSSPTRGTLKHRVPLKALEALAGGLGKAMSPKEIGHWFTPSVVVVRRENGTGSGFVVGSSGYVLTCAHCVDEAGNNEVVYTRTQGGQSKEHAVRAIEVYRDHERDLSLLKFTPLHTLRPIRLAPLRAVAAGEPVTVIANPGLGDRVLTQTITEGVISGPSRELDGQKLFQTSAAVNPGSSGGPVFNSQGLVVGMVTIKGRIEAAGFAVGVDQIYSFLLDAAISTGDSAELIRSWRDATGRYTIQAGYVDSTDEAVQLRPKGRDAITVPLSKLSEEDQAFVQLLHESRSK